MRKHRATRLVDGVERLTPEYQTWNGMLQRCYNSKHKNWSRYGGRGIAVCARWHDFDLFVEDMAPRPAGMSLDRIDTDGDYAPENCRWADAKQQARNRCNNVLITFRGETRGRAEWAELHGLHHRKLRDRLAAGWPMAKALGIEE